MMSDSQEAGAQTRGTVAAIAEGTAEPTIEDTAGDAAAADVVNDSLAMKVQQLIAKTESTVCDLLNGCRDAKNKDTLDEAQVLVEAMTVGALRAKKDCNQAFAILQSIKGGAGANALYDRVFLLMEEVNKAHVVFSEVKSSLKRSQKLYIGIWMFAVLRKCIALEYYI